MKAVERVGRWLVVALVALTLGCAKSDPPPDVARKLADEFYQALLAGDIDKALTYCSPKRSPEEWRAHFEYTREKLGDVVEVTYKREEVNTTLRGRFFIFDYLVKYSGGTTASETLTLFHKVDEDGTFVVSHHINAEGFRSML